MPEHLHDFVNFRGDKLFNGAVNIGWFGSDELRTQAAATSFVFHGPAYHGVSQEDVGSSHGHRLQDTASFMRSVVRRCYGIEEQPFTLAIAGYGTGKSHLGLTLGALLSHPDGDTSNTLLAGIDAADQGIASEIKAILNETRKPCLVVALNGMQSFDLATEITRQITSQVKKSGLDARPLEELRPRFSQAASLVSLAVTNTEVIDEIITVCGASNIDEILTKLAEQDEAVYGKVHQVFSAKNINMTAYGGESVRDVIDVAVGEYCGNGRPFRSIVFLFDEFGRYTEFSTVRSHIAGSGVLQDLFEGIQAKTGLACFVGFIQFELNAYVQRVAPEYRNEILRYVTRYQTANRIYLSINLETLIASLIEKKRTDVLDAYFDTTSSTRESERIAANIARWFPQSSNHRLWSDPKQFHNVLRKGCWPLSAYSMWFLFHLAAAGKHLQERSALALLGEAFDRYKEIPIADINTWSLAPVDLWSDSLQHELITSEEGGQQGAITHAYASVEARHGSNLGDTHRKLLRAVVLASKIGLKAKSREDASMALSALAGLDSQATDQGIRLLQNEYNVIEWDEAFKEFDILGDAVPRTQFLSFVRQRVAGTYDESGKATLFASKATIWCDLLGDLKCDFAEENNITTKEWHYFGVTSNLDFLPMQVKLASDRWSSAVGVDEPRGTIIYCYVEPSRDVQMFATETRKILRTAARESEITSLPILVVLLCDEDGLLGQALAELAVLDESVSEEDRVRFGNLIGAHQEKMREVVRSQIDSMIKRRQYITDLKEPLEAVRLSRAGTELFGRIYKTPVVFPFDGFSTAKGNAADSCRDLTTDLILGNLDYDAVLAKPVKVKNRAVTVLHDSWGVFSKNGSVRTRPSHPVIRSLTEKWDGLLASAERKLVIGKALYQLCAPPYGANIASAGLFLGVFIAARLDKLSVVRSGQSYAISEWLKDGLFGGKFLDIGRLHDVEIVPIAEESSEWEILLDEWEQDETHEFRVSCLSRAYELKQRVPVPPNLAFRFTQLEDQSKSSFKELEEMARKQNEALQKMERGYEHSDVSALSWSVTMLLDLQKQMKSETANWSTHQIQENQPQIDHARQTIIDIFPEWLTRQSPKGDSLDAIGEFKNKMQRVSGNLSRLGLENHSDQIDDHTRVLLRKVQTVSEAHQLVRDVRSWIVQNSDIFRLVRVAEIRGLLDIGSTFSSKLQGMSRRIEMREISEARSELSDVLGRMKKAEKDIVERA